MLEARDIRLSHRGRLALEGVTLSVAPGEVVAVAGPNGAGKSTLLAVMSGAQRPDAGAAFIDGAPVASLSPAALARRRSVLDQTPPRDLPFTLSEIAALGLDGDPAEADALAAEALAEMDLAPLAHRPLNRCSGGEAHRAHLARALAQLRAGMRAGRQGYLLIDEPTASLDLLHQQTALAAARAAADAGAGVLVVLHDLSMVAAIADRVALMRRGRIHAEGTPAAALTPETLHAVYGVAVDRLEHRGRLLFAPAPMQGDAACSSP